MNKKKEKIKSDRYRQCYCSDAAVNTALRPRWCVNKASSHGSKSVCVCAHARACSLHTPTQPITCV